MRFRREWIWVPAVCLVTVWLTNSINPACDWSDITCSLGVSHESEYAKLAILALALLAVIAILRVLKGNKNKDS